MRIHEITVADIFRYLESNSYDTHLGWLDRAYQSGGDDPKFVHLIQGELNKVRDRLPKGDPVKLYRGLKRPMEKDRPNTHWSESHDVAAEYGSFIYTAMVPASRVDWLATVVRRISWPNEKEISLFPGFLPEAARSMRNLIDAIATK
jgi:hypothetical protein